MKRTKAGGDSLRELLIACREHRLAGCPKPGPWVRCVRDELLDELKVGGPVEIGSAELLVAMMHAGLPETAWRRYALGGADHGRVFLLDSERLAELAAES